MIYLDFGNWMSTTYRRGDVIVKCATIYYLCKQKDGESIEDRYQRFATAASKLDVKPPASWKVSDFILEVHRGYEKLDQHI